MESINPLGTKQHFSSGLAEGSWKGMKKYLEREMLCPALRGRLQYDLQVCPEYGSLSNAFSVRLDGETIKVFNAMRAWKILSARGEIGDAPYPEAIHELPKAGREEFEAREFAEALREYRGQGIGASLESGDPVVRMFAIVDQKNEKRTLRRLSGTLEEQPEWLKRLYLARREAESIMT